MQQREIIVRPLDFAALLDHGEQPCWRGDFLLSGRAAAGSAGTAAFCSGKSLPVSDLTTGAGEGRAFPSVSAGV
jgi:hypothetical protein